MGYRVRRRHELLRRRHRRAKIEKLKKKLSTLATKPEREKLIAKIRRISPFEPVPEK